jgi:hypothetical protein
VATSAIRTAIPIAKTNLTNLCIGGLMRLVSKSNKQ